jgi:hypothetical protein
MTTYSYTITPSTTDIIQLCDEIEKNLGVKLYKTVSTDIISGSVAIYDTNLDVILNDILSVADKATLDGIISAHVKLNIDINILEYGVYRDQLKAQMVPIWGQLSFSIRQTCVKHYCYPVAITQTEWTTYYTDVEHENNWNVIVNKCRDYRLTRLYAAFAKLSFACTTNQVAVIYLNTKAMCIDYYYGNMPHLVLWISNGTYPALGIDYSTTGFAQMGGYTTALRDQLIDIINNGNYQYKP